MRLLITTQVLDRNDPVLGFFHRWVEVLAPQFDSIIVIALSVGAYTLPENVSVRSLGKEQGRQGKRTYAARFLGYLLELRGTYEGVFVHMNPEYVLLGAPFWRGLPVMLWYNHEHGSGAFRLASPFVSKFLHTSPYAASAGSTKSRLMPAGIDTELFSPGGTFKRESIYFQGRVAPAKRLDVLLDAYREVKKTVPESTLDIAGPIDTAYEEQLAKKIVAGARFLGPQINRETPRLYREHAVSVNLTAAGNFDKTVLESIACGTPAVVSSPAFRGIVPESCFFTEGDARSLADTLTRVLALPPDERRALGEEGRRVILEQHSLPALVEKIVEVMKL